MEEFKGALAGVSDEYNLSSHASHLMVPTDVWFDWSTTARQKYFEKVQELSMEDIFRGKEIEWPTTDTEVASVEFKEVHVLRI